jgi:hypothetical protein
MSIVMVLLFPLGAIYMRLGGNGVVHGALQIFSIACLIAGFALGVQLANYEDEVSLILPFFASSYPFFTRFFRWIIF